MSRFAHLPSGRKPLATPHRNHTVCVVDPQPADYRSWEPAAEAGAVDLQIVGDAGTALRLAHAQHVDLWVINTELPGLSGCELCSMLKSRLGNYRVHLVANEYSPAAEQAAWQSRATLFACKDAHIAWLHDWLWHGEPSRAPSRLDADGVTS